jgi:archaellum component FlaC
MKKLIALTAVIFCVNNANAFDLASVANKVQSAADKASAKIEEVQAKNDAKNEEAQNKIEEKIKELKEKIANWQSSDSADTDATKQAIANAKESIEKLMDQLKVLKSLAN